MRPVSAIIVHRDSGPAEALANSLRQHFRFVSTAASTDEARHQVNDYCAQLVVLDLETADFEQLKKLRTDFPATMIVCTHRIPDDQLWVEALGAGAIDCCHQSDVRCIVLAACRNLPSAGTHTVAA